MRNFLKAIICLCFTCLLGSARGQNIYTFAGSPMSGGYTGDGNFAVAAQISSPRGVAVSPSGIVYISDSRSNVIRKVNAVGIISTYAGDGTGGFGGDGGAATNASLRAPAGIAVDKYGNLYIADSRNSVIRKVDTSGIITTVAGDTVAGFSGDGGSATAAQLNRPSSIAVDTAGNLYIADGRNNRIRKVTTAGTISTFAGTGTAGYSGDGGAATAADMQPNGVAVAANGTVYVSDGRNDIVRAINTSGIINAFAGTGTAGYSGDGGAATAAMIAGPNAVYADAAGNVYIADNNDVIRLVNPSGIISTIAGNGTNGYSGDGGAATAAMLNAPLGVSVDASANIYIADNGNSIVRRVGAAVRGITITTSTSDTVCAGTAVHFVATAIADAHPHYQWQVNGSNVGTDSTGFTTSSLIRRDRVHCLLLDSAGSTIIAVSVTFVADSVPSAGYLTGPSTLCVGSTLNVRDSLGRFGPGGLWTVSNTTVCTVSTAPGGRVTGLAAGTDTVIYTVSNSCGSSIATKLITVVTNYLGPITGPAHVCPGATITLADTSAGGSWRSRPRRIGTIDSATGVFVAGTRPGIAYITYGFPGCFATDSIIVDSLPFTGTLSGPTTLNRLFTGTMTSSITGGTWTCSPAAIATINPTTGVVTGLQVGTVDITYSLTGANGCVGANTYSLDIVDASGVHEVGGALAFSVAPNPASGSTTLSWSGLSDGTCQLILTDITGRQVWNDRFNVTNANGNRQLNLSGLQKGIYILKSTLGTSTTSSRLVIE